MFSSIPGPLRLVRKLPPQETDIKKPYNITNYQNVTNIICLNCKVFIKSAVNFTNVCLYKYYRYHVQQFHN